MKPDESPSAIAENWLGENAVMTDAVQQMMLDMATGGWSFAKLTIVNAVLREWVAKL